MSRILISILIFISSTAFASLTESIPSWHWSYELIDQLQVKGYFPGLNQLNKPYTRGDVAKGLIDIRNLVESMNILSEIERSQYLKLVREFRGEILQITKDSDDPESIYIRTRLQEDLVGRHDEDALIKGIYRIGAGVDVMKNISIHNMMNFDQYKVDDPLYVGKEWRGVAGFTEQAYLLTAFGKIRLKAGRDFLRWGKGKSGTLLFSDICRPMDQFLGSFDLGPFRYSFLTAVLDDFRLPTTWADSLNARSVNRYLTAHRLNWNSKNGKVQIAVTEAVLYGGVYRSLDWVYVNPFMIYHGVQMNQKDQVNPIGTIEVLAYPVKHWQLYVSLLIDDIQVEKTVPGDLEPNEIGWIVGTQWADPFNLSGITLNFESARVTNRTYKTPTPWETFTFRNDPLGHPLGNDFDYWQVGIDKWFGANLKINMTYSQTRKGEGSLYTPWDAPWFNYTLEEGYSEPYLTGIVEKRQGIQVSVKCYPSLHWGFEGEYRSASVSNYNHIKGQKEDLTNWKIGVWFLGDVRIKL